MKKTTYINYSNSNSYLLVDGYNIIFAWDELRRLAAESIDIARDRLIDILCNYQGMNRVNVILVFDAYKVKGGTGSVERHGNIFIVYTREAETADNYIEKTATVLSREYDVRVATSDGLEQVIIMSKGAVRVSASEFYNEVKMQDREVSESIAKIKPVKNNMLIDNIDSEAAAFLEQLRRKK